MNFPQPFQRLRTRVSFHGTDSDQRTTDRSCTCPRQQLRISHTHPRLYIGVQRRSRSYHKRTPSTHDPRILTVIHSLIRNPGASLSSAHNHTRAYDHAKVYELSDDATPVEHQCGTWSRSRGYDEIGCTASGGMAVRGEWSIMDASRCKYQELIAHLPLVSHPDPKVLVIGGGVILAVLRHDTVE